MCNSVKQNALSLILRHNMLQKGDRVLVALSGGADSMTLLSVLRDLQAELSLKEVAAAHIHHGLRGEEADRDADFVQKYCKEHGITCHLHRADVSAESRLRGKGVEETGREIRYEVLSELARQYGYHRIATAHTKSDAVESLLLHITRGSGLSGLQGIPPIRQNIIRPLLLCSRAEIEMYCAETATPFVCDSTNADVQYARNRIRNRVLPELYEINPRTDEALSRLMSIAQTEEAYWREQADKAAEDAFLQNNVYDAAAFAALHPALRARTLHRLIDCTTGIVCEESQIRKLEQLLADGGGLTLGDGVEVTVKQGYFTIKTPQPKPIMPQPLSVGTTYFFGGDRYRAEVFSRKKFEEAQNVHRNLLQFACDYDKIAGAVVVRTRLAGDMYSPYRRGGRKTLKKWMNAEHIPEILRDTIPVVADDCGIVLVVGMGCDERTALDEETENVLVFIKQ